MPEKRNNSACPEGQQPPVASVEATLMLKYYSTWMDRGAREAVEHQKKKYMPYLFPFKGKQYLCATTSWKTKKNSHENTHTYPFHCF